MRLVIFLTLILNSPMSICQTANTESPSPTIPNLPDANPQVLQIAIEDQWDRGNDMYGEKQIPPPDLHGKSVTERDVERQNAIRKLLANGDLRSGTDFWLAALVFQHSLKADGVMLAHILATTAAAKGNGNGKWLAAASLDRYLWDIGQPQIFGTNFKKEPTGKWTMEPYSRETLSDVERAMWCVIPVSEQAKVLSEMQQGKPMGPTGIQGCR